MQKNFLFGIVFPRSHATHERLAHFLRWNGKKCDSL